MSAAERYARDLELFGPPPVNDAHVLGLDEIDEDEIDADHEPAGYDAIDAAVRMARAGLSVAPFALTGRDKKPALGGSWLDNATSEISPVVQDFEHAVSRYGNDRVLVGWAVGRDGYCAMDDDHGLDPAVAAVLDHPHAVNITYRGRHIIFENPAGIVPGNSTARFPDARFGEFRGRGGLIVIAGVDRPGFDPDQLQHAGPFPFPDWLTPASESAPPASTTAVEEFLAAHDHKLDTDRLAYVTAQLRADPKASRHERLIKYAGWLMRDARAGIVTAAAARDALWDWWRSTGVEEDYPRVWEQDFHRYIACAIGYANNETDETIAARHAKARTYELPTVVTATGATLPRPVTFTDAHVGEAFGRTLVGRYLHCRQVGGWQRWDGRRWLRDESEAVFEEARQYVLEVGKALFDNGADADLIRAAAKYRERGKLDAVVTIARRLPTIAATADEFDQHPDLLNVGNGVVDLRTGRLGPHDPALKLTQCTDVDYVAGRHPDVDAVLDAVTDDVRPYLQRLAGYAATGHVTEDVLPVWDGSGSNAKTTMLMAWRAALGGYARAASPRLLMKSAHDEHPTLYADLRGRRFVTIEETAEGGSLRVETMKALTGGTPIPARFIRGDYFEFLPTHLLVVATNHRPAVNSTEHATWRRLRLIPFPYRYEHPDRARPGDRMIDTGLRDRLRRGRPQREATLAWIVAGAIAWNRDGLGDSTEVRQATEAWRRAEDVILRYCHDRLEFDSAANESVQRIYDDYRAWCDTEGRPASSLKEFKKRFEEHDLYADHGVDWRKTMTGARWFGVGFRGGP